MNPQERFFAWLECVVNSMTDCSTVVLVQQEHSHVVFSRSLGIIGMPKLVLLWRGSYDPVVLATAIVRVFREFRTRVWADDEHKKYLIGAGHPIELKQTGDMEVEVTADGTLPGLCWENGRPVFVDREECRGQILEHLVEFHDETAEVVVA